ncbi:MAG TPA: DUF2938 domain-containing protein [Burkholderiales bacterium]|nr:DUF2938 domain-containing protein [Burkholderiales bacterium]
MDTFIQAALIGTGATAVMDAWGLARTRFLGIAPANYALVGRWLAYMPRGRFRHASIAKAPPVRGERAVGWIAHYATGIAFAGVLLAIWGVDWARNPALGPALLVGIGSVAAPFLLMQPGMGAGIAASRTPRPNAARFQSLVTHTVFGLGLFVTAYVANLLKG